MTDDQIIFVARAVRDGGHWSQLDLLNFGRIIALAEREACAKVCDDLELRYWNSTRDEDEPDAYDCAAAIRARGQA